MKLLFMRIRRFGEFSVATAIGVVLASVLLRTDVAPGDAHHDDDDGFDPVPPNLRPLSKTQEALLAAYTDALKGMLATAERTAERVLTIAFALATAYTGLIGLVSPEKERPSAVVAAPIILLAFSVIPAILALWVPLGAAPTKSDDTDDIRRRLDRAAGWKRWLSLAAVLVLAAAIVVAGLAVIDMYVHVDPPSPRPV